jgi:ribosomal protein L6P/L9E
MKAIFPKELAIYFFNTKSKLFLIIISNLQGWFIICVKYNFILVKSNKLYIYNLLDFIKTYIYYLINTFIGFLKNYFQYVKLKGMGYKVMVLTSNFSLKLGFSHRILYLCSNDLRINYLNKQLIKIESRSLLSIKSIIYLFQNIRKMSAYKIKGVFLKGSVVSIKINTKKSKV